MTCTTCFKLMAYKAKLKRNWRQHGPPTGSRQRPKKSCVPMALHLRTAVLITIAKPIVAQQTDLAPPASFNSPPAAPATLAVMNCLLCPARNAIQTTPPKHHTLALPPAKRFTAASIAWSPLTISNLIDATAHFKHDQQHIKLKNFVP